MIRNLIRWALDNRLIVILLTIALIGVGGFSLVHLNVEAYPDPAPAIVEVISQYPGASAEEVEREVTIPLEIALAGMPGLHSTRSKSLFGLSHVRNQFEYGTDFFRARLEVLNRIYTATLPPSVTPTLANTTPTGEIYRYIVKGPKDALEHDLYTSADLKSMQDWVLEREFRRVPRIADVVSFGGAMKRYEVQPDPERLKGYGISLDQLQKAITDSNSNVGGDFVVQGPTVQAVRGLGLIGGGLDPTQTYPAGADPAAVALHLRKNEDRRLREIRSIVLAATNNVPIRLGDVVSGGRYSSDTVTGERGVVVGAHPLQGRVAVSRPLVDDDGEDRLDENGARIWEDRPDVVQGIVLLRKGEQSLPALTDVKAKVKDLNSNSSKMLPGTMIETIYDRTRLVDLTTHTVRENVVLGIVLVSFILLVFLNHFQSAMIVAVNIPLALLFAMSVLYFRGKSANLLSLGAVDFGIIVDSSVIMVEAIYRSLSAGEKADLSLKDRILSASGDVERGLFYSTIIMVFALLPLFTMQGPEGQIFGPMADTYAFALGGALILALTLSPVLCRTFFANVKPVKDNLIVQALKGFYGGQLKLALRFRWISLGLFLVMCAMTAVIIPFLGAEFMPELEEGNIYVRGTFPVNVSLDEVSDKAAVARRLLQKHPETLLILNQMGRPDDGTDPTGFYNCEFSVPLKNHDDWPRVFANQGWRRWIYGPLRSRSKDELIEDMNQELNASIPGVDWNFSQYIRDNVMETLSGVKGENAVKIFGPDLNKLEEIAEQVKATLINVRGIENVGIFRIKGQANLEFAIDRNKCALWNVSVANVQDVLATAVGGKSLTQVVEGERKFDVTLRWPERLRYNEETILDIPVEVVGNVLAADEGSGSDGNSGKIDYAGGRRTNLAVTGSRENMTYSNLAHVPRRRLRDLVTPIGANGEADPDGAFVRSGASTIYREKSSRLIAVKFSVRGRDLAGAVAEAQTKTQNFFDSPYSAEWSGEFQEMQEAVHRLVIASSLALVLIIVLLYLALRSLLDAFVVLSNVVVMSMGGVWALYATGEHFNISAGVGFISVLGVGIMNGLLLVSWFNKSRSHGVPLQEALIDGIEKRIRPLTMTALTAIFGLLPAAVSTQIGSETQRPLAIVVVGGMITIMLMVNLIPVLYSFYGHREPPEGGGVGH
ncbi:efflux RND transporter permease subunit [Schlesneria paludicola]|uniref:efflux RND transporter permease subunit n=1 Tax=Schlesneria paludicola TaxID=360056 RepID=UPI00029B0CA1|nr:efflux RND transporter permease subunit [Schlesneria paludicola]